LPMRTIRPHEAFNTKSLKDITALAKRNQKISKLALLKRREQERTADVDVVAKTVSYPATTYFNAVRIFKKTDVRTVKLPAECSHVNFNGEELVAVPCANVPWYLSIDIKTADIKQTLDPHVFCDGDYGIDDGRL
jgi:hypothetical protein